MVVNVNKLASELNINTPDLLTRVNGRSLYEKTVSILKDALPGETVLIDFEGIRVIDSSFADEYIVKIIAESPERSRNYYVKLANISKTIEINIDSIFKAYANYNKERLAVITEDLCTNNNYFIGPLHDLERDIIHFLRINRTASIPDIIEFTGLDKSRAKELMLTLGLMRLVKSDDHRYHSL